MARLPEFFKGTYTEAKDERKDAYLMRQAGFDKEEKEEFERMDKAHGKKKKPKTMAEDVKADRKIISKIKAKHRKHEAKESKAYEKREDKNEKK
jgi:hypothetical protein